MNQADAANRCQRTSIARSTLFAALLVGWYWNPSSIDCFAQEPPSAPSTSALNDDPVKSLWRFRCVGRTNLETTVIRLGDVAEPIGVPTDVWTRLRGGIIGLIPVGQGRARIERDRLAQAVARSEGTEQPIEWIGPDMIEVSLRKQNPPRQSLAGPSPLQRLGDRPAPRRSSVQKVSAPNESSPTLSTSPTSTESAVRPSGNTSVPAAMPVADPPSPHVVSRLESWIRMSVQRQNPELMKHYDVQLASSSENLAGFTQLQSAGGIMHTSFREAVLPPQEPVEQSTPIRRAIMVTGRGVDGPIDAQVVLQLKPHPMFVAPKMPLRRGHRIRVEDLTWVPVPEDQQRDDYSSDVDDFIGKEIVGLARQDAPLSVSAVAPPVLIHRGDQIELRVVGGGVRVTTMAKALDDGHLSQLIEVETTEPRRRMVARVAASGLAEIVTRSPRVR
ncbi:flagellar basal body P-ring formation chaperone FlgA [Crateriforma spongiae]|uniref:flagellar basal body P-ring formation chaperone FlgA n=1 Tax=Crateriforma spongiae TaxID=2724528 RepID=UPI0039B0BE59